MERSYDGSCRDRCDSGALCHRESRRDFIGSRGHLRHDEGDQSRARRIHDAGRVCGYRGDPLRREPVGGDSRRRAACGRADRRRAGTGLHPAAVRPHDRHDAGNMGTVAAADRCRHLDCGQYDGGHFRAAGQLHDRRILGEQLYARHHRSRGGARCRAAVGAAAYVARPDRARHDAESANGRRAGHRARPRVLGHLRHRRGAVGTRGRVARTNDGCRADHGRRVYRQGVHHGNWRRPGHRGGTGQLVDAVRRDQSGRHLRVDARARRGCAAGRRHRDAAASAAWHHRPLLQGGIVMTPVHADRTMPVADALSRFSRSRKSAALALAVGMVMLIVLPRVLDDFALVQATVYAVMAILALSLGFVWGFGGILCFGQSAFFGLGAYTYAIAVTNMGDSTVPFVLAIVLPAAFAAVLGYLIFYGRLSDVYMGVITLTVTLILFNLVNSTAGPEWKIGTAALGGFNGIPNIAPLNTPGNVDDVIGPRGLFELSLGALLGVY